jgi:two-component system, chemotaxis family, protein-glutamate methylesterase/glutaminase
VPGHDIIVIGASAGGVDALRLIAAGLPADLPAAVFVTIHVPPGGALLHEVLSRAGALPAETASEAAAIEEGRIYVAPPDHHLVLQKGRMRLVRGLKENRARPAVDPLFRSAALTYGPRVIGVVLTGSLDDGAVGLATIKSHGGLAVVQDPADALFPGMPRSALAAVRPDVVAPASEIAAVLACLARQGRAGDGRRPHAGSRVAPPW